LQKKACHPVQETVIHIFESKHPPVQTCAMLIQEKDKSSAHEMPEVNRLAKEPDYKGISYFANRIGPTLETLAFLPHSSARFLLRSLSKQCFKFYDE
jgi:hypothetical protein